MLIEYVSSLEEEDDIDLMQARKCCDFKRMLLDSLNDGDGVGIPIPLGYEDVQVLIVKTILLLYWHVLLSWSTWNTLQVMCKRRMCT
jgi:hypothetical protein